MGYTAYNLNVLGYEEFAKRVELLFKDTDAVNDPQYKTMMEAFANHAFLRRIHTVDNAAIPYQLHAEVVNRIIDNQGRFYPWLIDAREHILKVLTSRIPYYVGPLDSTDHGKAGENGTRFAWVKRLAGHEDAFVSPWNYEDHIDIDTTAELFIRRMTGECSYLDGEDVLAKNSLLYEKYCFFNELASLSFTEDGDSWMPFDAGMRKAIYDAASDGKTMTVKRIESVLQRDFFIAHPHVRGTSNPKAMSSKRSNYAYFCRLFDVKALSASDMSMAEDLVLWNTVFEDRDILRRKILKTYGDLLTEKAVDDFCHKRLSGWGKLSERLLTGIWADTVKQTVTAEKQRELYVAQQEAQIAAETKKVELAERQVAVKERELDATVRKQAEADRYAAEQKADAELYTRTKNAEAAKVEAQNKSDADLYSAQKTAEGVSAKAKAEAEATRLKGEADGAAEKAHGEGVAAGIKAQTEAYNGMENAYLLANRYIDVMPEVAEAVAKPLTAVDSIKMYGDGNATKLVRDTTGMVDQVTSGLKDATGIDLTELLSSFHQPFQPREDNE